MKNAAIIFLSVMLVLTLFSNTINNYMLPEVAVFYPQSGTITARIRGNGVIKANETYEVKAEQSRKVQSVKVRVGDTVAVGDVLLTLSDTESDELKQAQTTLDDLNVQLQKALASANTNSYVKENVEIQRAQEDLQALVLLRDQYFVSEEDYSNASMDVTSASNEVTAQQTRIESILTEIDSTGDPDGVLAAQLKEAQDKLVELTLALSAAQDTLSALDTKLAEWTTLSTQVKTGERHIEDLLINLEEVKKANGVTQTIQAIDLATLRSRITEQETLVNDLRGDATGTSIVSDAAGKVTAVSITAGNTTSDGATLITIEVVDRGYSVSFPVTVEQSQKVRVGDVAEISNYYYWGSTITATLASVANNPENPGQSRILIFDLSGQDIQSGSQLSVSVGQRSQNYDLIVPKSAIRQDNNGSFVLVVMAKNSMLINRYVATRVDVQVLASDDTSSAISGGFSYGEPVITSSTKPLVTGMQVRLAEG